MKYFYGTILCVGIVSSAMISFPGRHMAADGETGYSDAVKAITITESVSPGGTENIQDLLDFAMSQLHKPYAYGGKGPDRFDCSGFTGYVFRHIDISLPASSALQAKMGSAVQKSSLLPGDLVFFRRLSEEADQVSHVGIVTEVLEDGVAFIHSSTTRGVIIDDLIKNEHYSKRYVTARRVL